MAQDEAKPDPDLPPLYAVRALRADLDAFVAAVGRAETGDPAGTFLWTRRSDCIDLAVVLEPDHPRAQSLPVCLMALAFDNVQTVLAEAGMELNDVVQINTYVTDVAYFSAFRDLRNRLFTTHKAASTAVAAAALAHPGLKVEIEAVAAKVD